MKIERSTHSIIERSTSKIIYEVARRTPVFDTDFPALECLASISALGGFLWLIKHGVDTADEQGRQEYDVRKMREAEVRAGRQAKALAKLKNPVSMLKLAEKNIAKDTNFPDELLREVGSWESDEGAEAITETIGLLGETAEGMSPERRRKIKEAADELRNGFEAALDKHTIRRPEPDPYTERGMLKELTKQLKKLE